MALNLPRHGGDLAAAEARWGNHDDGWLDLSTGINPWPYHVPPLPPEAWTRLPGAAEDMALRQAAAVCFGAPGAAWVLPVPGSSAAIQWLPRVTGSAVVAVLGPTYAEHEAAWRGAGHEVRAITALDEAEGADIVVVVNPNNPDGRVVPAAQLADLGRRLLVVDEAFGEVVPDASIIPHLRPGMVVLRSFGKFHGLAGLRLGFVIGQPETLEPLARAIGPWSVSGPALAIGAAALADTVWATATRAHLASMAARLDAVLAGAGMEVIGGTSLFRLAARDDAEALYDRLGRHGILVRAFPSRPTLLRFGLPAGQKDLDRLKRALG